MPSRRVRGTDRIEAMTTPDATEGRYASNVGRAYRNATIELTWEPQLCIHFAACIRGSSEAFDPHRHPWIDVDAVPAERLAEIVARCPTGALHARLVSGDPAEAAPDPATIVPMEDGPLIVHGRVQLRARNGDLIREDTRIALCRCGNSLNKPFCDDSHYRMGFRSADPNLDSAHTYEVQP